MINIDRTNIKDFIDFIKDPDVKETKKQDKGDELLLSYNTGETFLIKKDLAQAHGLVNNVNFRHKVLLPIFHPSLFQL